MMSLFTNEEFGHLAIRLNECRCPICKRIAEKICDDHKGIDPTKQRIADVIAELEKEESASKFRYEHATTMNEEVYQQGIVFGYQQAISLLKNGVKKGGE